MLKDVTLVLKCDAQLQVYYHIGHISDLKDRLYISTKTHTPNAINQPYVLILSISQPLTTHSFPPPHVHGRTASRQRISLNATLPLCGRV